MLSAVEIFRQTVRYYGAILNGGTVLPVLNSEFRGGLNSKVLLPMFYTVILMGLRKLVLISEVSAILRCPLPDPRKRLLKENRWIRRLGTLAPSGLNRESNHESVLRLVIPQSDCGDKAIRLCQQRLRDVTVTASFTTHRNLRSILRCANK